MLSLFTRGKGSDLQGGELLCRARGGENNFTGLVKSLDGGSWSSDDWEPGGETHGLSQIMNNW